VTGWLKEAGAIVKDTVVESIEDGVPARGAALSYYVLLSLGPLLVLIVGALEFFLSSDAARQGVVDALQQNVGAGAASTVEMVLARAEVPDLLAPESILTVALLLFGATAVFGNVQGALNKIWGVEGDEDRSKREIALTVLRNRARSFFMILLTGVVIGASFIVTSGAAVISEFIDNQIGGGSLFIRLADAAVSFLFLGALFGAIYRTLPETRIEWSAVWVGAFVTALLFVLGKSLVAWLIASAEWTSYYGPGASVVAFLAWIYFSSQIFFLGAEFTWVWSRRRRRRRLRARERAAA
jgi:membrane protein